MCIALFVTVGLSQEPSSDTSSKKETPPPTTRDGKRLLTALDTLKIKGVGAPTLSPNGKTVAYTVNEVVMEKEKEWKSNTQVWTVPLSGSEGRQYTRDERNSTNPRWSPDGKYLGFLSDREKEGERQVWLLRPDGGEAWRVTNHKGGVNDFGLSPDGKKLILTAADQPSKDEEQRKKDKDDTILIDRDFKMVHLWLWDIDKQEEKRLTEGNFTCSDPRFSSDGNRISFTTNPTPKADDGGLTDIWILTLATGDKKKLIDNPGSDSSARWSPDGQSIAYVGNLETHGGVSQKHLFVVPEAGGTARKLTTSFELDAGTPVWSADGKALFFGSNTREAIELFACDVASGAVRQVSQNQGVIGLSDSGVMGKAVVGTLSNSRQSTDIYRADTALKSVERVTDHNPWLKTYAQGEIEVLKWQSKDGTVIEGVLTKPVGFEPGRKYPFILNPHGGPTGASLTGFNAISQLFAANRYLVLEPNFRGSTGKGEKFAAANKNMWGIGDYQDCMAGVDAVTAKGWADPQRMGAYGWSYGGYMTYWILTQTDSFKAISPGAGLTNIYSMYSQNDIQRYLRWFYGDKSPWDNTELYWDRSPMKYVKQVKTPTLIMHGQNDTRVPIAQAQEFYSALVERGIPVEFVVFPREGHGISEPRHRLDRLRRYLTFFGKYLNNPPLTEPLPEKKSTTTEQ